MPPQPPTITLFPYTTLFRSGDQSAARSSRQRDDELVADTRRSDAGAERPLDRRDRGFPVRLLPHHLRERRLQPRSEEHTSELQSHSELVCRLLLEKKKKTNK